MDIKKMNINDVAAKLGISKSTVSRAISGKGRISEATRTRVMEYIEQIGYAPSNVARGLAQSRTYNIAYVVPDEKEKSQFSFFQKCMWGVNKRALANDYDVVLAVASETDITQLQRLVKNQKVDGFILGRTYENDIAQQFLKENDIPFVAVGSADDKDVIMVDNNNIGGCQELTSLLLQKGFKNIGLIGIDEKSMVNNQRLMGFVNAYISLNIDCPLDMIFMMEEPEKNLEGVVDCLIEKEADCIICMDDAICAEVLEVIDQKKLKIPDDICIASFFDSTILDHNRPRITTVRFNAEALGEKSCSVLFDRMDDKLTEKSYLLDYEVILKESTEKNNMEE